MIIEMLLDVIYNIMSILLVFEIPTLPAEVTNHIDTAFNYIESGAGILVNYTPLGYFLVLFGLILAIDAGLLVYHFVMWVLKKIPLVGIS